MIRIMLAVLALLLAVVANVGATVPPPLSEPGTFELLALGGVIAAVVAIRKRRGK